MCNFLHALVMQQLINTLQHLYKKYPAQVVALITREFTEHTSSFQTKSRTGYWAMQIYTVLYNQPKSHKLEKALQGGGSCCHICKAVVTFGGNVLGNSEGNFHFKLQYLYFIYSCNCHMVDNGIYNTWNGPQSCIHFLIDSLYSNLANLKKKKKKLNIIERKKYFHKFSIHFCAIGLPILILVVFKNTLNLFLRE